MCDQKPKSIVKERGRERDRDSRGCLIIPPLFSFSTIPIPREEMEGRKSRRDKPSVGYTLIRSIASVPFGTNENATTTSQ